jgi:hypothetical protein
MYVSDRACVGYCSLSPTGIVPNNIVLPDFHIVEKAGLSACPLVTHEFCRHVLWRYRYYLMHMVGLHIQFQHFYLLLLFTQLIYTCCLAYSSIALSISDIDTLGKTAIEKLGG